MEFPKHTPEFWPLASPPNLTERARLARELQKSLQERDVEVPLANTVAAVLAERAQVDLRQMLEPFAQPHNDQTFALDAYIEHLDGLIIAEHHANFPDCKCTVAVTSPLQEHIPLIAAVDAHIHTKRQGDIFRTDNSGVSTLEHSLTSYLKEEARGHATLRSLMENNRLHRADDLEDPDIHRLLSPQLQGRYVAFVHFQTTYDLAAFSD